MGSAWELNMMNNLIDGITMSYVFAIVALWRCFWEFSLLEKELRKNFNDEFFIEFCFLKNQLSTKKPQPHCVPHYFPSDVFLTKFTTIL